jgi:hypothetical protein
LFPKLHLRQKLKSGLERRKAPHVPAASSPPAPGAPSQSHTDISTIVEQVSAQVNSIKPPDAEQIFTEQLTVANVEVTNTVETVTILTSSDSVKEFLAALNAQEAQKSAQAQKPSRRVS